MDCKSETTAPTEAELMKTISEHARAAHKMETIPPDVMAKVKAAIKKESFPRLYEIRSY